MRQIKFIVDIVERNVYRVNSYPLPTLTSQEYRTPLYYVHKAMRNHLMFLKHCFGTALFVK